MSFIKYPQKAFTASLTHAENTILLRLLLHHYRYCKNDYEAEFYLTDRDLASLTGCSLRTIYNAKKSLMNKGIIFFYRGFKNRTYYQITPT